MKKALYYDDKQNTTKKKPYEYLMEAVDEMSVKLDETKDAKLMILYTGHGRPKGRRDSLLQGKHRK